jgi:peptidoglycan/xylan/chitin deacetylase (PgdA/CDA1 family)
MTASLLLSVMFPLLLIATVLILILYTIYRPPAFVISHLQRRFPSVLFHIPTTKPLIALTIDDTPSPHTSSILSILAKHQIHATFFIIGSRVPGHESTLHSIIHQGHDLANHTMHDTPSYKLSLHDLHSQITIVDALIAQIYESSHKPAPSPGRKFFRPASGFFTSRMQVLVQEMGYTLVLGDIYPHDAQMKWWRVNAWRILSQLRNGGVVICHDREWTLPMLEHVLPEMKRRGFVVGSLSEVLDQVT